MIAATTCRRRCFARFKFVITILFLLICLCQIYVFFWNTDLNHVDLASQLSPAVEFKDLLGSDDGRYKIWPFVWKAFDVIRSNDTSVGIATQCSITNMKDLFLLVKFWDGTISVTTFLNGNELDMFERNIRYMVNCNPAIQRRVSFHVVFPISHPPYEKKLEINNILQNDICSASLNFDENTMNYDEHGGGPYPVNLLRNVAVRNLYTSHVLVLDIDMIPSMNLNNVLLNSPIIGQALNAFVIPAFEIRKSMKIPVSKSELIHLWNNGDVRPFYEQICWKCQKYTLYDHWKIPNSISIGSESYTVNWYDPWEPFYVAMKKDVVYDERFEQYGFNRISQLCHLHMAGFSFSVLYESFIIHNGFKDKSSFHSNKDIENEKNKIIYRKVKSEMLVKYPKSGRRC